MATDKRITMLPEDRAELEDVIAIGIDAKDKRAFADASRDIFMERFAAGSISAERIIRAMASDGIYKAIDSLSRRQTGVFKDSKTGKVLNVPTHGSVPMEADDGSTRQAWQAKLWTEMSRSELVAWVAKQRRFSDSMIFKLRGLDRLLSAWEQYPEARTALEVCERAGINPDELDIAA